MRPLLCLFYIAFSTGCFAQILPGMEVKEIHGYMAVNFRDFILHEPPNADELNFIKYEHISGDKTLLVFVSEDGSCNFTRLMGDIDYLDEMIEIFDSEFTRAGKNKWITRERGSEFIVALDESDWIFTVTVRKIDEEK
jgi:hypothetical protein